MKRVSSGVRATAAVAAVFTWSTASAQVVTVPADAAFLQAGQARFGFIKVGHDNIVVDPTVRRYTGMVAALGAPAGDGKLFSFTTAPVGPRSFALAPNDLRGWRLTVLSGNRFGQVFTVSGNTESLITVTADKGSLDGIQVHDVFIVESVDANGVSMFGSGAASAGSPGT